METDTTDTKANSGWKSATGNPCLIYSPREDATPEGELAALANIYRFVLECHDERKKSSRDESGGEGAQSSLSQELYPMPGHDE